MLPVVHGDAPTAKQIWIYTLLLLPVTLLLVYPLSTLRAFYAIAAIILGSIFIEPIWDLTHGV